MADIPVTVEAGKAGGRVDIVLRSERIGPLG